ncbi:MAG TPA: T9SS type A sorting domain-containing protein, partial [Bacteroidia bacterium]|nr:T9SS type A sorting domain-containing protein [Bacteroidia bacterium]
MKKTLLLVTALVVSVTSFTQNIAKKAVNPKYLQKSAIGTKNKILTEPQPIMGKGLTSKKNQSVSASCPYSISLTTSWNCFGTGGGLNTSAQNCLSYNQDLNSLVWTQRGSKTWTLTTTSGFMQATVINATTLVKDSILLYRDSSTNHARYPSGTFLNPLGNTDYHKALAIAYGVVTDNTNWTGTAYTAKPLWSKSAVTHTVLPAGDSMYAAAPGKFGHNVQALVYEGTPSNDVQALPDGKTVVSIGSVGDHSVTCSNCNPLYKGVFVKAVLNGAGNAVNWTIDSTSLTPSVHKGSLGYQLREPRIAFGPDGLHGYVIFLGVLSTVYGNKSDSAMTPILYQTTDGGNTWTQKLAGYDWMTNHPEVEKNVGELIGNKRFYTFDELLHGADLTVDVNNVLHFVTCVDQSTSLPGPGGAPANIDSLGIFSPIYQYDYVNYHPIIWDFMTDGTCWSTMMVDSIITAACGNQTIDSTSLHSPMGGSMPLSVTSHITVSRSQDGTKIFYGWADSDTLFTGQVYNIQPDILMKAYDVTSGKVSATINVTNGTGTCFYPYLSDISYFDGTNWVVPAVYTVGDVVVSTTGQTTYDASSQGHYMLTNCGTFNPATDFSTTAPINTGLVPCTVSIKQNSVFESAIGNYPNPFNNNTTISVTLTENKNLDVKVYNAIGNLVFSKKVSGNVGENTVNFDASNLSSGVYYYTVTAGNQQATKK